MWCSPDFMAGECAAPQTTPACGTRSLAFDLLSVATMDEFNKINYFYVSVSWDGITAEARGKCKEWLW